MNRSATLRFAVVMGVLLIVGLALALVPQYVGDNYCGRLFFDSRAQAPCDSARGARALLVALLVGPSSIGLAAVMVLRTKRRLPIAVLIVGGAVSMCLVLIGLNRLLEPTEGASCGSVVNRHRSFDSAFESACKQPIDARTRASLQAFAGAAVASVLTGGLVLFERRRHVRVSSPSRHGLGQ